MIRAGISLIDHDVQHAPRDTRSYRATDEGVDGNARLAEVLVGVGRLIEPQEARDRRGDTRP
jgi:hypothetical protein